MNILSTTLAAGAYAPARRATASEPSSPPKTAMIAAALAAARKPDEALVRAKNAQAMASPLFAGADAVKTQARAKLQQVRERLNILKKLYAANPKEMARALAQVFKELKAAVKAFKDAGGQELSMSEAAVSAAFAPPADKAGADKGADDPGAEARTAEVVPNADEADVGGDASVAEALPADEAAPGGVGEPEAASETDAQGTAAAAGYDAAGAPSENPGGGAFREVLGQVRKAIGEDGLEFAKEVRALSNALSDVLESARVQILARRPDKKTDEAFKDADDELKSLREDVEKMAREIRQAVPAAGMRLSMTV